jgi:hypothetical protein
MEWPRFQVAMRLKLQSRFFRFSLRTMFIVMTLLCCWMGWEASVVHERQSVRRELQGNPAFQFTTADAWFKILRPAAGQPPRATIPTLRVWLGDEAIQQIWFMRHFQGFSDEKLNRLSRVFPEAQLQESQPEPCHPGCFPRGTLVDTPEGNCPIERIRPGDVVLSLSRSGKSVSVKVQSVFTTENRLWKVETEEGVLFTTETQPLCLVGKRTLAAGKLQSGNEILQRRDGNIFPVNVLRVGPTARMETVFNLVLGDNEIFVAGGFLARSKPPAHSVAQSRTSATSDSADD